MLKAIRMIFDFVDPLDVRYVAGAAIPSQDSAMRDDNPPIATAYLTAPASGGSSSSR